MEGAQWDRLCVHLLSPHTGVLKTVKALKKARTSSRQELQLLHHERHLHLSDLRGSHFECQQCVMRRHVGGMIIGSSIGSDRQEAIGDVCHG